MDGGIVEADEEGCGHVRGDGGQSGAFKGQGAIFEEEGCCGGSFEHGGTF